MLAILGGKELLDKHPKGKLALGIWFMEQAKTTDVHFEESQLEGILVAFLKYQPRQLYDFFDIHDVRIAIVPNSEDGGFTYYNNRELNSFYGESRQKAEESAIRQAFTTLENLLP